MSDIVFVIGMGCLIFFMGLGWFNRVSRPFYLAKRKTILSIWGGACLLFIAFFTVVVMFHLGSRLTSWMG